MCLPTARVRKACAVDVSSILFEKLQLFFKTALICPHCVRNSDSEAALCDRVSNILLALVAANNTSQSSGCAGLHACNRAYIDTLAESSSLCRTHSASTGQPNGSASQSSGAASSAGLGSLLVAAAAAAIKTRSTPCCF